MMNGELNCCLELLIVYIESIKIIFSAAAGLFGLRKENLNASI